MVKRLLLFGRRLNIIQLKMKVNMCYLFCTVIIVITGFIRLFRIQSTALLEEFYEQYLTK